MATSNMTNDTLTAKKEQNDTTTSATFEPMPPLSISNFSIERLVAQRLKKGVDYDTIPNRGQKPVLLKGGAEHLAEICGFRSETSIIERIIEIDKNFAYFEVMITIYGKSNVIVAQGIGSCNSLEAKFQRQGIYNCLNTVLKMAKKRAYVDAVLTATKASGVFTQDIEDLK